MYPLSTSLFLSPYVPLLSFPILSLIFLSLRSNFNQYSPFPIPFLYSPCLTCQILFPPPNILQIFSPYASLFFYDHSSLPIPILWLKFSLSDSLSFYWHSPPLPFLTILPMFFLSPIPDPSTYILPLSSPIPLNISYSFLSPTILCIPSLPSPILLPILSYLCFPSLPFPLFFHLFSLCLVLSSRRLWPLVSIPTSQSSAFGQVTRPWSNILPASFLSTYHWFTILTHNCSHWDLGTTRITWPVCRFRCSSSRDIIIL